MYERGVVVVAADPFGNTPRRPYLIVSDTSHPFAGKQYIALGITTKEYPESLPLTGAFETGTLNRESFVSPWAVVSLQDIDVDRAVARVTDELTGAAVDKMTQYTRK
ncbi:hypothetical protein OB955_06320 [Halobacteria archaeon AArc-m2/3/4]|uniref:PemK-like, MazF-like toxin of type II toxin-antitoxin system n=1 Tax=Natronoglomus mannanivorans TaxID=2979990 RepID=A0AAP2YYN6_9EURY|nr:hypothetical protein [Halobacteria archaeon AArc-xg1-1]MCU4972350.1 hypothetical protein [Halobacteria archaeon AArc-m2/3/4]